MASHDQQTIGLTKDTADLKECVLQNAIGVGDCQQKAGSRIALERSQAVPGLAHAVWQGTTLTRHSPFLGSDTWRQTFLFLTAQGGIVTQIYFDGPDMGDSNKDYPFLRTGSVSFNPNLWDQIKQVQWIYQC